MRNSTQYLYGISPRELETMLYPEALLYKIEKSQALRKILTKQAKLVIDNEPEYGPIRERYIASAKAAKHNVLLLQELADE